MKDQQQAKRLLRAMSEVDDRYFLEAQETPRQRSRRPMLRIGLAAAACLALLLAGRILALPQTQDDEPYILDGSPIREVADMAEAEAITGFSLTLPQAEEPYTQIALSVLDGTGIDASYQDESGEEGYLIRKAAGDEDISGDYNDYAQVQTISVGSRSVTLKGSGGTVSVAAWQEGGYSYAICAEAHPLSVQETLALIAQIE